MEISVIVPTLDEAARIGRAVESAWEAGADEVLVVDGGSRDGTVAEASRRATQVLTAGRGRASQQNVGAAAACGDVLVFQHADTWFASGAFDQIRRSLEDHRVDGGAFRQRIDAPGWGYRLLERGNAWRVRWLQRPYGDQGIFMRRPCFQQLGGFPDVPLMEDLLLMRALAQRSRPVLLPGPIYVSARRWQRYGLIRQTLRNWALVAAFRCGVPVEQLARWYPSCDGGPVEDGERASP